MRILSTRLACACALAALASAAQAGDSGFLTNASLLKPSAAGGYANFYLAPEAKAAVKASASIMIDQPEIFIAADSKYQGVKPDDLKVISDGLRGTLEKELTAGGYKVVGSPGPGVLFLRTAISGVQLEKKKRPILAYTPVGAVVHAAKNLATDVTSKVNLKNAVFEAEVLDSTTNTVLAAATDARSATGSAQPEKMSWNTLEDLFTVTAKRVRCRLDKAGGSDAEWAQCSQVQLEKPPQKS